MYTPFTDQDKLLDGARKCVQEGHRRFIIQAPTGSGKTVVVAFIIDGLVKNNMTAWFVVPRKILLEQASSTLSKFGIQHGIIWDKSNENKLFQVHVVSKDTLTRRIGKIKSPPNFIFFDECHEALDQQIAISEKFPASYIIGVSATPELDSRSFSDLYTDWVSGDSIHELQQAGRLSTPRYFMPPLDGIDDLMWSGSEPNEDALAELFAKQKVYGKTIDQWRDKSRDKPTVSFCRSIKAAEETAKQFRDAGHNFQCIEGSMSKKKRKYLFDAFKGGDIYGLTCADLLTYGVDLPLISSLIMLKKTRSIRMFYQMIGRILRISPDGDSGVILDQVNNFKEFGYYADANNPHVWNVWNNAGIKQERKERQIIQRLCPHIDFMYCTKASCVGCEHHTGKKEKQPIIVNCNLVEYDGVSTGSDTPKPRPAYQDELDKTVENLRIVITAPEVEKMVKYAKALGEDWRWIYEQTNTRRHMVNVALLSEIGRQYGYKPGWTWHKTKELRR